MSRVPIATEDFNRAGPALGGNWSNLMTGIRGDVLIDSSTRSVGQFGGLGNDHCIARWVGTGSFTNDQYASIVLVNPLDNFGTTQRIGVVARAGSGTGAALTCYQAYIQCDSASTPTAVFSKVVGGTTTAFNTGALTLIVGDRIDIECEGTTIRLCVNSVPLGGSWTVTDASIASGAPGVIATTAVYGDDWVGGALAAAVAINPYFPVMQLGPLLAQ